MGRTYKVIKYLERYKEILYCKAIINNDPDSQKQYRHEAMEVECLIAELKMHGCRRIMDV